MHLFLTSSPCNDDVPEGVKLPCIFFERNQFVKNLRERVKPNARLAVIPGDPYSFALNDGMADTFANCFEYHGMHLSSVSLCDGRNEDEAMRIISESDVVLLGGGHVPSQSCFLERIGLRALLWNYSGVVMGVSAGSMNCAVKTYAQPELPGESVDPDYRRFIPGLGLTDIMILPHYQKVKNMILDGKRLYEDITFADSFGREFIAMPDGSYVLQENGKAMLFGEGYRVSEGKIRTACRDGEYIVLNQCKG